MLFDGFQIEPNTIGLIVFNSHELSPHLDNLSLQNTNNIRINTR